MGMELTSENGSTFEFSGTGWAFYLNLAEVFGWKPEGTKKPKNYGILKKWHGAYDSNEGQFVTQSDAQALSVSLERALSSEHLDEKASSIASQLENTLKQALGDQIPPGFKISPNVDKNYISNFVSFCKGGGFYIE